MQNATVCQFSSTESWVILSEIEQNIKRKIEAVGVPLKDWDINIYRGILTGYNEAFIISGEKKEEILNNCKTPEERTRTIELIRPLLRGRDIKRYSYEFADLYIITTFPSLKIDIELYPAIKEHLMSFGYDRLKQTGEPGARKKTNNKWFETQDAIGYWEEFSKQKIVWKIIGNEMAFFLDENDYMMNNACYILTGENLYYLLAFLNSKIIKWYSFQTNMNKTGVGDIQIGAQNLNLFPIPFPDEITKEKLISLVNEISSNKLRNNETYNCEQKIDNIIYELYKLNDEEMKFIEIR